MMKKQELLNILNTASDSISLHDGSLIALNYTENSATFIFCIGEHHYIVNNLEKHIDNLKNYMILCKKLLNYN